MGGDEVLEDQFTCAVVRDALKCWGRNFSGQVGVPEGPRVAPGMPADLYIRTEERTFFEYILRPVFESFSRSFRER